MKKTWDFDYIRFLEGCAVISVLDPTDYKYFKKILKHLNINFTSLQDDKCYNNLMYWRHLATINAQYRNEPPYMSGPLYFGFENGKGITIEWKTKEVVDYFGKECIYRPRSIMEELGIEL